MMQKLKHIAIILLSMNIILSSIGMNLFVHSCKAADIVNYSFLHDENETSSDCPYCHGSMEQRSSLMDKHDNNSCCESDDASETDECIELDDCCDSSAEFKKVDIESKSIDELKLDFYDVITFTLQSEILSVVDVPVKSLEFLKHYSGISPPYESNYIHFISSILE